MPPQPRPIFNQDVGDFLRWLAGFFSDWPEKFERFRARPGVSELEFFLWIISAILSIIVAALVFRTIRIWREEARKFKTVPAEEAKVARRTEEWISICEHLASENESDWRVAILEADALLDELVRDLGYPGENLGDRLKVIPAGEMKSLEAAWEAHKFRNRLAHLGPAGKISREDVLQAIGNYERVFREFDYI